MSRFVVEAAGGVQKGGVAQRPARRKLFTRGYLWFSCGSTVGKALVMGIRGKPSPPEELPYPVGQSGRICRFAGFAEAISGSLRMAGSDRSNRVGLR